MQLFFPMFPLIHAFGRIGCFCVGCCYGSEADGSHLSVTFIDSPVAPNGIPLYPVQLVEAGVEIGLFLILALFAAKKMSGNKLLALYCLLYGMVRFWVEFYRGDEYRGVWLGLSTSQHISLFTVCLGTWLLWRNGKSEKRGTARYSD